MANKLANYNSQYHNHLVDYDNLEHKLKKY
jgi:hypothetical protein